MIQIGKYNPIFFAPRKYRYGTGEYVQRFDLSDTVRFELLSGKGETAAVRLNNLSTGESQPLLPQTFSVSDETDAHVYSVQPGEGFFSVTVGDTSSVESEPFRICSCSECTSLMEYSNADNDADGGAFVNGDEKITFMFRFEGGIKPVDTEHRCENESFRDQRQRIHNLYSAAYEVLKLTVGDTSTGCPEWYAGFFNRVLCLSDVKINGESLARSEGSTPEKTQMQEGSSLVYFTINLEAEGTSSAGGGGNFNPGGGGGFSVYIITTDDLTAASDANLFSALRTLREIEGRSLSKQHEDTTNYLLNLLGGIISPFLTSPDFISGALGTGFTVQRNADGTTYAEFDKIMVRMKAVFQILEILKADVAGGEIVINSGPRMRVTRVERTGNVPAYFADGSAAYFPGGERAYFASSYRLHFLADDGDTAVQNLFRVGDLARCQTFDIRAGVYENVSNRFWWRLVTAVGDDWIEVSDTVCAEGSDAPKEGDTVVQMGSDRDTDRQALIVLSAYGQGAPSLAMYQGIDSFSLSGKEICRIGYNAAEGECEAMFGRDDGKGYFLYSPSKGLRVAGNIEVLGGSGMSSFDDAMDFAEQVNGSMAQYMGYSGWEDMVSQALRGNTLIKGGVINTSLINVSDLFAGDIYAGEATITKGKFKEIEVNDATITNSTLTDVTVTGEINANAGKIGGFTIRDTKLSYYYTEDGEGGQPSIVINASGSEFFRVNEIPTVDGQSNSSPFLHIRADRRPAIRVDTGGSYSDAPTGIRVTCNAAGYGKAIESYGNVLLKARDGENVKVNGLALNVRQMSSGGNIGSSDDIIYTSSESNMTVYLPRSGHEGKVLFIRKCGNGNVTINGNGLRIMPSGRWTSDAYVDEYTIVNGNMCVLFCTGGIWIATTFG